MRSGYSARAVPTPVVGIAGLGYMGLATGLAFAHRRVRTVGYDVRADLRHSLREGRTPIHEEGLPVLLKSEIRSGRFSVVDTWESLAQQARVIFLCLPTPRGPGGRIDLRPLRAGVREAGTALRRGTEYRLVVVKSTVVPGTTTTIIRPLLEQVAGRDFRTLGVASNPEFLAEGSMVRDALGPERIVVGIGSPRDEQLLRAAYRNFPAPLLVQTPSEAELVKYASNAFLAVKVTFANEIARIAERVGGDIDRVMAAVGADSRIGAKFLSAGPGFGGSCFEKDVRALVGRAEDLGVSMTLLGHLTESNREQTRHAARLVRDAAGGLRGKTIALLGLSFKAGTDDVRESRALFLAQDLIRGGASVRAHDPVAIENFRTAWEAVALESRSGRLTFASSVEDCLKGVDAAVIQAAWPIYKMWGPRWTRLMRGRLVIDLRRAMAPEQRDRVGLRWVGLGVAPESRTPDAADVR